MIPTVSIREALTDPSLLGSILAGESWLAQRVLLIAAMGEALTRRRAPRLHQANRPRVRTTAARRRTMRRRR
jgi:hypothetical protein